MICVAVYGGQIPTLKRQKRPKKRKIGNSLQDLKLSFVLSLILCASYVPADALALPSQSETVKALKHYLSQNDSQIRTLLEYENLKICGAGEAHAQFSYQTLSPAAGFERIEKINQASREATLDDWQNIYDSAAQYADVNIERNDRLKIRMETEEYCDKYFQRIGDKKFYRQCQFRYLATQMTFAADRAVCKRDAEALGSPEKIESQIYGCMRLTGWKNAVDWSENIELPVAPRL